MADANGAVWWIELLKVSPALITALFVIVLVVANRVALRAMLNRVTKFKGFGIEAELGSRELDNAIAEHQVAVSIDDRSGALRRLSAAPPRCAGK